MDDDLRSRYRVPRRDYSQPVRRPHHQPYRSHSIPSSRPTSTPHQVSPPQTPVPQSRSVDHLPLPPQPQYQKPKKRWIRRLVIILLLLGLAGSAAGVYYFKYAKPTNPLPQSLTSQVNFPLYYPAKLPSNYQYQVGSAVIKYNFLAYKISDGSKLILVTEQAKPSTKLDLNSLASFKPIDVNNGSAVVGNSLGNPAGIMLTSTTLINLSGLKSVSQDDITSILQTMKLLTDKHLL